MRMKKWTVLRMIFGLILILASYLFFSTGVDESENAYKALSDASLAFVSDFVMLIEFAKWLGVGLIVVLIAIGISRIIRRKDTRKKNLEKKENPFMALNRYVLNFALSVLFAMFLTVVVVGLSALVFQRILVRGGLEILVLGCFFIVNGLLSFYLYKDEKVEKTGDEYERPHDKYQRKLI